MASKPEQNRTVFIVDDESVVRDALSVAVEAMGFSARCFSSANEFLEFIDRYRVSGPVCLIVDIQMPETSGIELLQQLAALGHELPATMMTGAGATTHQDKSEALGAAAFLEKPFRSARLQEVLATVLGPGAGEIVAP